MNTEIQCLRLDEMDEMDSRTHAKKKARKFSFFPRSITEWNLLPADLVNCKSLSNFKLNLGKLVNK